MSRFRFLAARKRTLGSHLPRGGRFVLEPWVDCQYLLVTLGFPSVLAVDAVIGEPVSDSYFPVLRENTGNLCALSLGNGMRPCFPHHRSVSYGQIP